MLRVFICEDNQSHKKQIEKCIKNCIMIHNLDIEIVVSTGRPQVVIAYLEKEPGTGLYFLDVDLRNKINGLKLADIIRSYDPRGFIVFITTHDEALPLTFQYKVEAMDFISKDDFFNLQGRIYDCILNAHKRYTDKIGELQKNFSFTIFDKLYSIEYSKINYFETTRRAIHKVFAHTVEGDFEFYGTLAEISEKLDESFFRCHNSYIINLRQVLRLEKKEKTVYFKQGGACFVSIRKMKQLIEILDKMEYNKP